MTGWAEAWSDWQLRRYNTQHVPSGPGGGEFTSSGESGPRGYIPTADYLQGQQNVSAGGNLETWAQDAAHEATQDTAGSAADSLAAHSVGGQLTPARQALHDRIVAAAIAGHKPRAHPVATFLGGGPASGKSTISGDVGSDVRIDADAIKEKLPEYGQMLAAHDPRAASFTHEESSAIAKKIQAAAIAKRLSYTLDGTGDTSYAKMSAKIAAARKAGYTTRGKYVTVDTGEAVRRANQRAKQTGRMVPEAVTRQVHASVSEIFPLIMDELDRAELWDNNGAGPVRVGSKTGPGQQWLIHNAEAWERFLAKGGKGPPPPLPRFLLSASHGH